MSKISSVKSACPYLKKVKNILSKEQIEPDTEKGVVCMRQKRQLFPHGYGNPIYNKIDKEILSPKFFTTTSTFFNDLEPPFKKAKFVHIASFKNSDEEKKEAV